MQCPFVDTKPLVQGAIGTDHLPKPKLRLLFTYDPILPSVDVYMIIHRPNICVVSHEEVDFKTTLWYTNNILLKIKTICTA